MRAKGVLRDEADITSALPMRRSGFSTWLLRKGVRACGRLGAGGG